MLNLIKKVRRLRAFGGFGRFCRLGRFVRGGGFGVVLTGSAFFQRIDAFFKGDVDGDEIVVPCAACVENDKGGEYNKRHRGCSDQADTSACCAELGGCCDGRDRKETAQEVQKQRFRQKPRSRDRPRELLKEGFGGSSSLHEQENDDPLNKDKVGLEFETTAFFGKKE